MPRFALLRPAAAGVAIALLLGACSTAPHKGAAPGLTPSTPAPGAPALSPQMQANADTLTRMAAQQDRLYHVAAPLLIDNAELCKTHARNLLGFTAKNRHSYPGDYNDAAHAAFGMGEQLQVTGVLDGSGAARAGLKVGDLLVAAGDKPLPAGKNALSGAAAVFGPMVASSASLPLTVDREGAARQITVPVTRACGYGIELGNADNVNAYADGQRVLVTRGLIAFVRNNDELAYVLARALAHNTLGHAAMQRNAATIGSMIDNLVRIKPDESLLIGSGGIKAMPADLDAAADRLAVYMVARAGYNIDNIDDFWKRLTTTYPATVLNGHTANHPAVEARIAAINKAVAEVKAKRSAKKPLLP